MTVNKDKSERGVILITVLIAVAILTTLVVDLIYFTLVDTHIVSNYKEDVQAAYIAKSGVYVVAATLRNRSLEDMDNIVSLYTGSEEDAEGYWSINVPNFPIGEGAVTINIVDERSKVNLNALVNQNSNIVDLQVKEELIELFSQLNIGKSKYDRFLASLINWLDKDIEGSRNDQDISGANGGFYRSLENPYFIKDGPLDSLLEIRLIDGMDSEFYNTIKRYVTVYPGDKKINFSTAPKVVLIAALQGSTVSAIEGQGHYTEVHLSADIAEKIAGEIISARDNDPIIKRSQIIDIIRNVDPTLKISSGIAGISYSTGQSDVFYVTATGNLGEENPTIKIVEAVIRKEGSGAKGVKIISWKEN